METTDVTCPICLSSSEDPVNLCSEKGHEMTCKECIAAYVTSTVFSAFLGSCPCIFCPSTFHDKSRKIIPFTKWKSAVPSETSRRYTELANSLLAFLCGGCHALKSLDVGFESNQTGTAYGAMETFLTQEGQCSLPALLLSLDAYAEGAYSVEDYYQKTMDAYFNRLLTKTDEEAWAVFVNLLKMIPDPERRVNLHLRYLRDHPRIRTLCCNREHCFRCKVKDFHEGRSCTDITSGMDHSVVSCPTCGITLAKGDGCNTVTCVCGKQFSWTAEKENADRCAQFQASFPEHTSSHCAHILCTEPEVSVVVAKAWQTRNRHEVTRELQAWFVRHYSPCCSQSCAMLHLGTLPVGVREAAEIWQSQHPREVEKCISQRALAIDALFPALYIPSVRAVYAHRLVNSCQLRVQAAGLGLGPADLPLLVRSASNWIKSNREEYAEGLEASEFRHARQFIHLYGSKMPQNTRPVFANCQFAQEWDLATSNDDLTYSQQDTSVERAGSVSCYPAAFAKLVADHCMIRVRIDAAPRSSNWLTFGLARTGMATTSSDGLGRTANTWGVADDRSSSLLPVVSACGARAGSFPKFQVGDTLTCVVDVVAGWCEVYLNEHESSHRFEIPSASMEEYCFAMTFANDHRVTILVEEGMDNARIAQIGELNADHSFLYSCMRKQIKALLQEEPLEGMERERERGNRRGRRDSVPHDDIGYDGGGDGAWAGPGAGAMGAVGVGEGGQSVKTSPQNWVTLCGNADPAREFERIRPEMMNLFSAKAEAWPQLTWRQVLDAASWYHENRRTLQEAELTELAYEFMLKHEEDAPFIAAMNLSEHTSHCGREEARASLAFMRLYAEEMNQWYEYDAALREPMLENVARGCRCLPRHTRNNCPCLNAGR